MVCKEDVIQWFKDAEAYRRIDVMCSLLNMCIPFELRFLGTCIEELGKHDYQELRGAAITANDMDKLARELSTSKGVLETSTRHRLTVYLSLLQSHNYRCANWLYCTILRNEPLDTFVGNVLKDDNLHTELLLLFTMAVNHPAFTFDQKLYFGEILAKLSESEVPQQTQNPACPPGLGGFYKPPPIPPVQPHLPIVLKPPQELPVPPGLPLPAIPPIPAVPPPPIVPADFMAPPSIWGRAQYCGAGPPPPPQGAAPDMFQRGTGTSPLVSQTSSPDHSRSVSPLRWRTHVGERIGVGVKDSRELHEFKTFPCDEGELEKAPWMDQMVPMKIPNGMLPLQNKLQPPLPVNYLQNELRQLQLDESLQCLSSSASSQSSDSQSPPDTPTEPCIGPHGPGRGKHLNGANASASHVPPTPHDLYANSLTVPYNQYHIPPYGNRSFIFSPSYRPQFAPRDIMYPIPFPPYVTVPYSSAAVPQVKSTCFNCGLTGHVGPDCKESTIEEITQNCGYQLDYNTPPPDNPDNKPHNTLQ